MNVLTEIRVDSLLRFGLVMLALCLLGNGIFAKRGLLDWLHMRRQNEMMAARIEIAQNERDTLAQRIQSLARDRREQELTVSRVLGYVRPDETVIEFE